LIRIAAKTEDKSQSTKMSKNQGENTSNGTDNNIPDVTSLMKRFEKVMENEEHLQKKYNGLMEEHKALMTRCDVDKIRFEQERQDDRSQISKLQEDIRHQEERHRESEERLKAYMQHLEKANRVRVRQKDVDEQIRKAVDEDRRQWKASHGHRFEPPAEPPKKPNDDNDGNSIFEQVMTFWNSQPLKVKLAIVAAGVFVCAGVAYVVAYTSAGCTIIRASSNSAFISIGAMS